MGGPDILYKMGESQYNRGPDDSGVWYDYKHKIGFSHQRLSIVDLTSAGNQPMISKSGRYVIVFNGEIYNHSELKKYVTKACAYSIEWIGYSDTEILLMCIEKFGIKEALEKSIGMFAFALWDKSEKRLFLAPDRMGEKPLYYGWQGEGESAVFLFGSDVNSFYAHPSFKKNINRDSVALFLRYSSIPAPYSIYRGISKLLPGSVLSLSIGDREPKIYKYWDALNVAYSGINDQFDCGYNEVLVELEDLIRASVKLQMVADVPLGTFLSGGVDSSLVTSIMQEQSMTPVNTFTIGFSNKSYDEAPYAKSVAEHLHTNHFELYVSDNDVLSVIPKISEIYNEPFSDSSQIPTFLISKLASEHVKVSLTGDGGDELFGGYNRYLVADRFWRNLSLIPISARRTLANIILTIPLSYWNNISRFLAYDNLADKLYKVASVLSCRNDDDLYLSLISNWDNPNTIVLGGSEPTKFKSMNVDISNLIGLSQVEKMMLLDILTYLPDDILTKVDRAAMFVSLETRVPLLDHRIVEFSWKVPIRMKISEGNNKLALRKILYKHVPRNLIDRPKKGFGVPIHDWLRGPLRDWAECMLSESRIKSEGFLDPVPVRERWEEHISGKRNWQYQIWNVLMFQSWLQSHNG